MIVDERGRPAEVEQAMPPLSERQRAEAEDRTSVAVLVVHEAIRKDGDEELGRPVAALAWSGFAAGLSMGFSFLGQAVLANYLPQAKWAPLLTNFGYSFGFVMAIVGRQQLFTENTLTAIIPLLAKRNLSTLLAVLKLWAVVLAANLLGAGAFAWAIEKMPILKPEFTAPLMEVARNASSVTAESALLRGIFAGWLIAMVVWMNAATDSSRISIIIIFTYLIGLAGLTHIVAGTVEVMYLVANGNKTWLDVIGNYMLPTLAGNILGGVALVSALNHAQVIAGARKASAI